MLTMKKSTCEKLVSALFLAWTSQGLNLGPPDYEPQISIFMILCDM